MAATTGKKPIPTAFLILGAMVLGILIGYLVFIEFPDKGAAKDIAGYISIVSDVFLRLIKMLIGPLVFSTLVVGIAHMGDAASVGRVFLKAMAWFVTASLVSLILGLILANVLQPGHNLGLPLPDIGASANLATGKFTLKSSSTTSSPSRLPRPWPITRSCRSSCSPCSLVWHFPPWAKKARPWLQRLMSCRT